MFETAAIPNGPASDRVLATCMGMTGQAILLACAIVIPMLVPAVLPQPQGLLAWIEAPALPAQPPVEEVAPPVAPRVAQPFQLTGAGLIQPLRVPATVTLIDDPPLPAGYVPSTLGAGGRIGDLIESLIAPHALPAPVSREDGAAVPAASATPRRVKIGGLVKPAVPIHRVEPVYPVLAQQARIQGVVVLEGVIGTDGRIRELRVKSGHPLLVRAALDAVRQWLYEPTLLNGDPTEVVQPIQVTFQLR